jgi:Phage capsid family
MPPAIKTIQDELRDAHERIRALVEGARTGDREITAEEQAEVDQLVARMQQLDGKRKRDTGFSELLRSVEALAPVPGNGHGHARELAAGPGLGGPYAYMPAPRKSLGQAFVEHEVYQHIRAMPKGGNWQSPPFELNAAVTITPSPAPPAGFPDGISIQPLVLQPLDWYVFALFAQGTLSGSLIQYLQESVWTNAAAPVPVNGTKPESTLTFAFVNLGLTKIAHWIPVPDEFLDDVAGLQSYIDARMQQGVLDELEDQVLNGTGVGGNMQGVLTLPNKTPDLAAPAGGVYAQAIAAQRAAIYALSHLRPDAVVMSPATWVLVSGQTSDAGGYLAGPGTFAAGPESRVAGLRVVESPHMADGTALLGAFQQGGQLYRKGGVTVQATNSHADFFIKNTTAIRAELRAALAFYRPQAFGLVTGLVAAP